MVIKQPSHFLPLTEFRCGKKVLAELSLASHLSALCTVQD